MPEGGELELERFSSELSERLRALDSNVFLAMSNLVEETGDILKEGFGDKLLKTLEDGVSKLRTPWEKAMAEAEKANIKTLKEAGELRLSLFTSVEQRKFIKLDQHLKEEENLLEKSYNIQRGMLKARADRGENIDAQIGELTKEHEETLTALHEKGQKERLKLTWSGLAEITGAFKGAFRFLGVGAIATTALLQSLEYVPARAKLEAARMQAFGGAPGTMPTTMFAGMPAGLIGPIEKMQLMAKVFTQAPRLINETAESTQKFVGFMGNLGFTVDQSMEMLIEAQRNLGFTSSDLVDTFSLASGINKKYGVSVGEAADLSLKMVSSLRMMGMGTRDAIAIINTIPTITKLGIVSPQEMQGYATAISSFIGGMGPSQLGGIMMYLRGGGLPTADQLTGGAGRAPQMMGELYQRIRGQFGPEASNMRLYIAEGFAKGMGISGFQTVKATQILDDMMKNMKSMDTDSVLKELEKNSIVPTEKAVQDGLKTLSLMHGTMGNIETILKETLVPIATIVNSIAGPISRLMVAMGGGGNILGGAGVGAGAGFLMAGPAGIVPGALIGTALSTAGELTRSTTIPGKPGVGQTQGGWH